MGMLAGLLEGIVLNPSVDASIANLITGIASQMLAASNQPAQIKQLGTQMIASSHDIVAAVLANTSAAKA